MANGHKEIKEIKVLLNAKTAAKSPGCGLTKAERGDAKKPGRSPIYTGHETFEQRGFRGLAGVGGPAVVLRDVGSGVRVWRS